MSNFESLKTASISVEEALHAYRTNSNAWERANDYVHPGGLTHQPSSQSIDPGVQLRLVQPLPHAFTEQYDKVQYKSFMGLFPQINRAWLTVDSNLFLWAYSNISLSSSDREQVAPNDFYLYEGLNQIIVSVALVNPRPNVFLDKVIYLLAVATTVEVTLLGVTFTSTGEIALVPTQISIPTDNVLMLKIVSTPSGRIFMAGADGVLYEFFYESEHKSNVFDLFSGRQPRRVRKIAHKSSSFIDTFVPLGLKNLLSKSDELVDIAVDMDTVYTLSQTGTLSVYDVATDVKLISSVNVSQEAKQFVEFGLAPIEREFVSIHPISPRFANNIHLIITTSAGERIYFSVFDSPTSNPTSSQDGVKEHYHPKALRCTGYRPTPDRRHAGSAKSCVHVAMCERGYTVFADLRENQSDRLIAIYTDSSSSSNASQRPNCLPDNSNTTELVFETSLDISNEAQSQYQQRMSPTSSILNRGFHSGGSFINQSNNSGAAAINRTFAISSALNQDVNRMDLSNAQAIVDGQIPHDENPQTFWVLTSTAMYMYERVLPINRLSELLTMGNPYTETLTFCERYGSADTCAMCLDIVSKAPVLSSVAARLFYTFGLSNIGKGCRNEITSGSKFEGETHRQSVSTSFTSRFNIGRPSLQTDPILTSSGMYSGACLFLAKVLHPLWNTYITADRIPSAYQNLNLAPSTMKIVQRQLRSFISFLQTYPPDALISDPDLIQERYAHDADQNRFNNLMNEENMTRNRIMSMRDEVDKDRTRELENRIRTTDDEEVKRIESASLLALGNLASRVNETISLLLIISDHQLNRIIFKMPVQYRDLLCNLRFNDIVVSEQGRLIASALIDGIFRGYTDTNTALNSIGNQLQEECPSYFGGRDVELHRALAILRTIKETRQSYQDSALNVDTWNENMIGDHSNVETLLDEASSILKRIPNRIFDVTTVCDYLKEIEAIPMMTEIALAIGNDAEKEGNIERADVAYDLILDTLRSSTEELSETCYHDENGIYDEKSLIYQSIQVALSANSERFLRKLYRFLLLSETGSEILLDSNYPTIERFLEENKYFDLLWKYCAKHNRNYEAATILFHLGESKEERTLMERLNLLTCALHNAKQASQKGEKRGAILLKEIGNFLDVARVQMHVKDELIRLWKGHKKFDKAVAELDCELMNLTTLFNRYARPFKLYKACLEVFKCGSYRNESYIRMLWKNILFREFKTATTPTLLSERIQSIGREFYPSEVTFPIPMLVKLFENFAFERILSRDWSCSPGWAFHLLKHIGVPSLDILDGYRYSIQSPRQVDQLSNYDLQTNEQLQLHILKAAETVLQQWVSQTIRIDSHQLSERELLSDHDKILQTVSLCKNRLRGMNHIDTAEILRQFEDLERQLMRALE